MDTLKSPTHVHPSKRREYLIAIIAQKSDLFSKNLQQRLHLIKIKSTIVAGAH